MLLTSDRWKDSVRDSTQRYTVIDLYYARLPVPAVRDIPLISGSMAISRTDSTRRSGSCTLAATNLLDPATHPNIAPFGAEIGIRSGLKYPNGDFEDIQLGIFPITTLDWAEEGGGIPSVSFADRSYSITEQSVNPSYDAAGKLVTTTIATLLGRSVFYDTVLIYPSERAISNVQNAGQLFLIVRPDVKDAKIPGGKPIEGGLWQGIQDLAASIGCEIFFAPDGFNVILQPVKNMDDTITTFDTTFDTGPNGNIITCSRSLAREGAWNTVYATGVLPANAASAQLPPFVKISDNDTRSPTYVNGPYGQISHEITSDFITDPAALTKLAVNELRKGLGLATSTSLTVLPDSSLDVGDIVKITFLNGDTQMRMIDSIDIDLAGGSMNVNTIGPNTVGGGV